MHGTLQGTCGGPVRWPISLKLAKLGKAVKLLRRRLTLSSALSVALGVLALELAAATVVYMTTGEAPLQGGAQTVALVVAGMLATFGVNHLRRRAEQG